MAAERPFITSLPPHIYTDDVLLEGIRKFGNKESHEVMDHHSYVAIGVDSLVTRWRVDGIDKVVKFYLGTPGYHPPISLSQLDMYRRLTNATAKVFDKERWTFTIPFQGRFRLSVNPVENIEYSRQLGCAIAVSDYVAGINVSRVDPTDTDTLVKNISKLNDDLSSRLGVSGVGVIPLNMKLVSDTEIVITDLCDSITDLKSTL